VLSESHEGPDRQVQQPELDLLKVLRRDAEHLSERSLGQSARGPQFADLSANIADRGVRVTLGHWASEAHPSGLKTPL
jgi:hypothetical protein